MLAIAASLLTLSPLASPAAHAALPAPSGEVLLVVRGEIEAPNVDGETHLDLAALESLPRHAFTSLSPWTGTRHTFEGVRLDVLLEAVGARSHRFEALALDDYRITFEDVDIVRYPVIVAWRQDGRALGVRSLGPLRIMFPFDEHPELLTETNKALAVWQLVEMDVR